MPKQTTGVKCKKCKKGNLLQFKKPRMVTVVNGLGYIYDKQRGEIIYYKCDSCGNTICNEPIKKEE